MRLFTLVLVIFHMLVFTSPAMGEDSESFTFTSPTIKGDRRDFTSTEEIDIELFYGMELGNTREEIVTNLRKKGYEPLRLKREHGHRLEIYAERRNILWEIKLDLRRNGQIIEIEREWS